MIDKKIRYFNYSYLWKTTSFKYIPLLLCFGISCFFIDFPIYQLYQFFPALGEALSVFAKADFSYISFFWPYLADSLILAFLASVFSFYLSLLPAFIQAKNTSFNKYVVYTLSAGFAVLRAIPSLVWAAILVSLFSIGRLAGFIAMCIILTLMSAKLLREQINLIENMEIESIVALGAGKLKLFFVLILPRISQVSLAVFFSLFETGIRASAILGLVGAGGIGILINQNLSFLRYDRLAAILIFLLFSILIIDFFSYLVRSLKWKQSNSVIAFILHILLIVTAVYFSAKFIDADLSKIYNSFTKFSSFIGRIFTPDFSYLPTVVWPFLEGLAIAVIASAISALFAFILSPFACSILTPHLYISHFLKFLANFMRTFPPVIMAILVFKRVGPGSLAGIIALAIYTLGIMIKLFAETLESRAEDLRDIFVASGAGRLKIYFAVIFPYFKDIFVNLLLYRMESNLRNSTILGIVGAGGIGNILQSNIRWRNWEQLSLILLFVAVLNIILDLVSYYYSKAKSID